MDLTAAANREVEEPEDTATKGQDNAQGEMRTRATRAQMETIRATRERDEERQIDDLQLHGNT